MPTKEILSLILQDFPESMIITYVCFHLLDLRIEWKKITFIAILETLTNLIRLLPMAFGMHSIILPITMALYIRIVTRHKLSRIFVAVIICLFVILASQAIYINPMLKLLDLEYQEVTSSPFLRALFSIPEYIALFLILVAKRYMNTSKRKQTHKQ